jgi:RND family efflux transporter MFP subunit
VLEATLEPAVSAQVYAQQGGAVATVRVAVSDAVSVGDTLAGLDPRPVQLQYEAARLNLAQAQSRLDRVRPLYTRGALSAQDLEQLEHQARLAELRLQEASLAEAASVLLAPIAGTVARAEILPGQHVTAGQPCVLVIDARDLQARLHIPVDRYHQVHRGQTVLAEYQPDPADDPDLSFADSAGSTAGATPAPLGSSGSTAGPTSRQPSRAAARTPAPLIGRLLRLAPAAEPGTDQCLALALFPGAGRHYPPGTVVRVTLAGE